MSGSSLGECSMSSSSQSKPEPAATSVAAGLAGVIHKPICGVPAASARLKRFCGMSLRMSVNLRLGNRSIAGKEIEVAAGLGLADMLIVKRAVAALEARLGPHPLAAPSRQFGIGDRDIKSPPRHVELDDVAA